MTTKRDPDSAEKTIRDIRRATRRKHNPEEKIRIVLKGLRGAQSIAELCRREGINTNFFGLSRLAVWWLRLRIAIERIEPGNPQQN